MKSIKRSKKMERLFLMYIPPIKIDAVFPEYSYHYQTENFAFLSG